VSEVYRRTQTGGRDATGGYIPGDVALAVGMPTGSTPEGFTWRLLTDLARLETGHTPSRRVPEYWESGSLPWIGIRDATGNHGRTIDKTNEYITELGEQNSSTRLLPAETVCLSRTASVGYVVVMGVPMCTSQDFVNWVCGRDLDYRYLKYILLAEKSAFLRFASGTTHQTVYFPEVKAFYVMVPQLAEQRAIAGVLGALDDKIESNRRIWLLRQELSRAYFRGLELRSNTSAALGDFYSVGISGVWGSDRPEGSAAVATTCLRGRDIEDFVGGDPTEAPTRYISTKQYSSRAVAPGEIWTAGSGSLGPSMYFTGATAGRWKNPVTYSNFVKRLLPTTYGRGAVCFHAVWQSWLEGRFSNFRTGTAMPNLDTEALLRGVMVPEVDDDKAQRLEELTDFAFDPRVLLQNESLIELRDALLPELLSGRLRVRDAEKFVEGAV
jgi:type I restriction enzyme S subunit